jgi:hypothetical protein
MTTAVRDTAHTLELLRWIAARPPRGRFELSSVVGT